MFDVNDYKARLARVADKAIYDSPDSRPWYPGRDVCAALRMDPAKCFPRVRREHKHTVFAFQRNYRSYNRLYLSRGGVETLVMLKGGLPRAELMAALDWATAQQ